MVYSKKVETASAVGEEVVPSSYFLDKELYYKNKKGEYVRKDNLTLDGMIGIHRITERRWSNQSAKELAKMAVDKLSTRPDAIITGHDDAVPIPAIAGIAQHVMSYKNAAFCDIISNNDVPGIEIAEALVDSGKYKKVIYASSPELPEMTSEDRFDKRVFLNNSLVVEETFESNCIEDIDSDSVDFVIVDHKDRFESKSDYIKAELDWSGVNTLDVICGCPGYVMAVDIADALITTKRQDRVACVGTERLEKMADPRHLDYTLYGSAAGASVYQASDEPGILCSYFKGFGDLWHYLRLDSGVPLKDGTPTGPYLVMDGHHLYRFARREVPKGLNMLIEKCRAYKPDLDPASAVFLLHQMNGKLLEHLLCNFFGVQTSVKDLQNRIIPETIKEIIDSQVPWSVDVYGNSSAATIPVTEDHARRGIILKRFSKKPFGKRLEIGSGTLAFNFSVGAGMILGGYSEIL